MNRILLIVAVGIAGLLFLAPADPKPVPPPAPAAAAEPVPQPVPRVVQIRPAVVATPAVAPAAESNERTPLISQMARLEARRRLGRAGSATYLDSLFTSVDSTVRRWDERPVVAVSIAVPADAPQLAVAARAGLRYWEQVGLGFSFTETTDPATADIVVDWIERFDSTASKDSLVGRTGLTELRSTDRGRIEHARITLARKDIQGKALGVDALRAIASHEFGHALGLPHSGRRDDIMYPTVIALQPSARDRASATLLYSLPPGPLQEPPTR